MDSLLSNYASSDEEEDHRSGKPPAPAPSSSRFVAHSTSLSSSIPAPKSSSSSLPVSRSASSLFSSLPPPSSIPSSHSSSTLFSLPPPKSQNPNPAPKRVVQLKVPITSSGITDDDEDDDEDSARDEAKATNSSTQTLSASSFLSNILPAPKFTTTLGALPSASGRGRRSIIEADVRSSISNEFTTQTHPEVGQDLGNYEGKTDGSNASASGDTSSWVPYHGNYDDPNYVSSGVNYENYTDSSGYDTYIDQVYVENNSTNYQTANMMASQPNMAESMMKVNGKRGRRSDVPPEIVEVKQDDLMKNRPRVDQTKSTGIAFGPSYQPVSTKGKPSKLHKRKHQIGALYFDMKQNETELAERRSRGLLTKSQTQGKYGW